MSKVSRKSPLSCCKMPHVEVMGVVRKSSRRSRGQALVEFALSAILLSLILSGAVEFGFIFGHKVELNNAARAGARWAADNSVTGSGNSWSSSNTPPANTTQGQVINAGTASLVNADIKIEYFDSSNLKCGEVTGTTFTPFNGSSLSACVTRGSFVTVTVTHTYPLFTKALPAPFALSAKANFEVMN